MPDYGWAYINLDVLKTIEGPANVTGTIGIIKDSTTLSGSKYLAYATASNKVGIGLDFPTTLPAYQLDVSASAGESIAARFVGNVNIAGDLTANQITSDIVISSSHLTIADSIIGLGFGSGSAETGSVGDRGFIFGLAGNLNQALIWDQTSGSFVLGKVGTQSPTAASFDIPDADLGEIRLGVVSASAGVSGSIGEFGSITLAGAALSTGVGTSGTPADNQIAIFTDADTIEGSSKLTFNGSILTLDAPLSSSGGVEAVGDSVFGGKIDVSSSATFASTIKANSLGADTDSTVVIVNSSGFLKTDEADSRIFGSTLVGNTGTPADNQLAIFTDATTVEGSNKVTFDGSLLAIDADISGSGKLEIVDNVVLGKEVNISGSAKFASSISGSSTLEIVGNAFLGGNLNVTGTIKAPNIGADTDNTVVILNSSGLLKTDEADSRIFGSTLVGNTGTPADNQLAIFTDATTVEGSSKVTFDGSLLAIDAAISGSGKLEIVNDAILGKDVNISGTLKAAGDVNVARKIIHDGDTDTLIDFTDDNIEFKVGNVKLLNLAEASDNVVTVGNGGDVDFQVKTSNNNHTIFAEGSTDRVGLGTGTPQARLHMSQSSAYPTSMPKPLIKIEHVLDADSGGGGGPTTTPLLLLTASAPSGEDYAEGRLSINKSAPAGALHVVSKGSDCLVANDGRVAIGHAGADTVLDVRGENKIFRVVNSKNDSDTNMFFVSGSGEDVGHFGSNATGVSFMVSGSSNLADVEVDGHLKMTSGIMVEYLTVTDEDAQDVSLSAAEFKKGIVVHTTTGGEGTVTMDTAANLISGLSLTADNMTAHCYYINDGNQNVLVSGAATGVTYADTGCKIKENCAATILVRRTGASAVTVYVIGGS